MKVNIRFLRQGLVKVEAPDNFNEMTPREKLDWGTNHLRGMSDKDIIKAIADFENPEINGYFDEYPYASAIEEAEGENIGLSIVETVEWENFCKGTGQNICNDCEEAEDVQQDLLY